MIKQARPAVTFVTAENIATFNKSDKVVIVGFFDTADTASNQTFSAFANAQRDEFVFGATNDASLAKAEGVKQPGVVMFKAYDEGKTVYTGTFEQVTLQAWAKTTAI